MQRKTFFIAILFILFASLTCFPQQRNIPQFSGFTAYSYFSTPSLNLAQRGFDGDFGVNVRPWLTLGFDFSYGNGSSNILPKNLAAPVQAQLAQIIPSLPPGFVVAVPFNAKDYTYEAGPQFNYRHFRKFTLFARPALGSLHSTFKARPQDCTQPQLHCEQILTQIVSNLIGPSMSKSDTALFYGVGGGVTWEATPNLGLRFATDYVRYNFFSNLLNGPRNSVRFSVGTKFSFGKNIMEK